MKSVNTIYFFYMIYVFIFKDLTLWLTVSVRMPSAPCHMPGVTGSGRKGLLLPKYQMFLKMGTQKIQGNTLYVQISLVFEDRYHLVFK